jgi:enolase
MAEEETKLAAQYAEKWGIQSTYETALTNLLLEHPADPMGFLYDQIVSKAAPPTIDRIVGREVLNGQGTPTVEVDVWSVVYGESQHVASASAPSCDFCPVSDSFVSVDATVARFHGKGVRQAVSYVTSILQPIFEKHEFFEQKKLDLAIIHADSTPNFKRIGSNTAIATSAALALAAANVLQQPLFLHISKKVVSEVTPAIPRPAFSVFHVTTVDGPISRIFFLPSTESHVEDQVRIVSEIYSHYEQAMHCPVLNNGCFPLDASCLDDILAAVEIAVSGGGHTLGDDVFLGLRGGGSATADFWISVFKQSPVVVYVEDPLPYEDKDGWARVTEAAGDRCVIAMGKGISSKSERISRDLPCHAVVVKAAQAGTILGMADAADACERFSKKCVISVSETETRDTWICDIAVAFAADVLVLGPMCRGENTDKLNRLLAIARELESLNAE